MVHWIFIVLGILMTILWGVMFLKQMRLGLTTTALDDKFTWGLYVQGFFYLSALAGGTLVFIAVVTLFEIEALRRLVEVGAAVSFGCLVSGGILLGSDLGKPFRGFNIIVGKKFASPLTWDFYTLVACAVLNLLLLLGLIPISGVIATVWSVLCLIAALGYVMIHTLFFLSRVGAGFRSQPFLGLDTLAQSLWGGMALVTLIALAVGVEAHHLVKLLLILTILVLISLAGAHIASLSRKRGGVNQMIIGFDTLILLILLITQFSSPNNSILLAIVSLLILLSVFLEKSHMVKLYQDSPTLPAPYSRFDRVPDYRPTASEWLLAVGSVGICVFLSSAIIYLKSTYLG